MTAPTPTGLVVITTDELKAIVREQVEEALAEHAPKTSDEPIFVTCAVLCERLGVSRSTVFRARKAGLPFAKCGDEFRYEVSRCAEWFRRLGPVAGGGR